MREASKYIRNPGIKQPGVKADTEADTKYSGRIGKKDKEFLIWLWLGETAAIPS
jgi:hypothetical protein